MTTAAGTQFNRKTLSLHNMTTYGQQSRIWSPTHGITFAPQARSHVQGDSGQDSAATTSPTEESEFDIASSDEDELLQHCQAAEDDISLALEDLTIDSDEESVEQPWTASFLMPAKTMQDALDASIDSADRWWMYDKYVNADGKKPILHLCTTFDQAATVAKLFQDEPVLGFDLEWEMSKATASEENIKRAVGVIQIASESRIAIFHIAQFKGSTYEELMPTSLRQLLEDPNCIKAGVNVAGDMRRVNICFRMQMRGLFELSHLYTQVKYGATFPGMVNKKLVRLDTQVEEHLGLPLFKGAPRTSTWMERMLKDKSDYAASDAYAGYQLFRTLDEARKKMKSVPARPAMYELDLPIPLPDGGLSDNDDESDSSEDSEERPTKTRRRSSASKSSSAADSEAEEPEVQHVQPTRVISREMELATAWASNYRSTLPDGARKMVGESDLRAYHLWNDQEHDIESTAAIMRANPLALSTVAGYIFRSICHCRLPCDVERLEQISDHLSMYDKKYSKIIVTLRLQSDEKQA